MNEIFLIHDLEEKEGEALAEHLPKSTVVYNAKPMVKTCVGCFSCWVKTPGQCIISDRIQKSGGVLAKSRKLVLVSRLVYGGFSLEVKAVLDRSIGYVMPYFRIVDKEMHHTMRYDNPFLLEAHFYGENISAEQQEIARNLVLANGVNLGAKHCETFFYPSSNEMKGALK